MKDETPPIAVRSDMGRLVPVDQYAQEQILTLPVGRVFHVRPEDVDGAQEEHRRVLAFYMVGIKRIFDDRPDCGYGRKWPTPNHLRRHILRAIGFAEPVYRRDGTYKLEVQSMAMDVMALDELRDCLEQTRTYCLAAFGMEPWQDYADQQHMGNR